MSIKSELKSLKRAFIIPKQLPLIYLLWLFATLLLRLTTIKSFSLFSALFSISWLGLKVDLLYRGINKKKITWKQSLKSFYFYFKKLFWIWMSMIAILFVIGLIALMAVMLQVSKNTDASNLQLPKSERNQIVRQEILDIFSEKQIPKYMPALNATSFIITLVNALFYVFITVLVVDRLSISKTTGKSKRWIKHEWLILVIIIALLISQQGIWVVFTEILELMSLWPKNYSTLIAENREKIKLVATLLTPIQVYFQFVIYAFLIENYMEFKKQDATFLKKEK